MEDRDWVAKWAQDAESLINLMAKPLQRHVRDRLLRLIPEDAFELLAPLLEPVDLTATALAIALAVYVSCRPKAIEVQGIASASD